MIRDLSKLSNILGHKFSTSEYLSVALRHSSLSVRDSGMTNERYEFLGDRVLNLVIAEMLLERFPNEKEGDIAKRHTGLVRQEALARVAKKINLGDYIEMDDGTEAKGGRKSLKVLSDCCEAIIAALYIDGGLVGAKNFIVAHWRQMLDETLVPPKDAKTALQEWAQGQGLPLPEYFEVEKRGSAHEPIFIMEVVVEGMSAVTASGTSKQKAEQSAAQLLLDGLTNE